MLEPAPVVSALPDGNISAKAEKGSTPVGSTPGGRVIEPPIARFGLALRQAVYEVSPSLLGCQDSRPGAGNRFHIGRQPLLEPMVSLSQRRNRQVDHLVREHPVVRQTLNCGIATKRYRNPRTRPAKGPAAPWTKARA